MAAITIAIAGIFRADKLALNPQWSVADYDEDVLTADFGGKEHC